MSKIFTVFFLVLVGCHEELNLRIDTNCTDHQRDLIISAVNEINNAWYSCHGGNGIYVAGDVEIETYNFVDWPETSAPGDDDDWVLCIPEGERVLLGYPEGINGAAAYAGNVLLFMPRIENEMFLPTVLHELGHYIGMGHSDDPTSIMYSEGAEARKLSEEDIETMCRMD